MPVGIYSGSTLTRYTDSGGSGGAAITINPGVTGTPTSICARESGGWVLALATGASNLSIFSADADGSPVTTRGSWGNVSSSILNARFVAMQGDRLWALFAAKTTVGSNTYYYPTLRYVDTNPWPATLNTAALKTLAGQPTHLGGVGVPAATLQSASWMTTANGGVGCLAMTSTHLYILSITDDKIYAWYGPGESHPGGAAAWSRDTSSDITLGSGNDNPQAIATDGDVMLVLDTTDDKVYAYDL